MKVIKRLCSATLTAANAACGANGAIKVCEMCDTDECNGSIQHGPIAILIGLSIFIVNLLLF